jgi:hypothetical protein
LSSWNRRSSHSIASGLAWNLKLHGYARREVGDHSPNWIGIPRHDMGVLAGANDPQPESLERSGPGQSAYELKDGDVTAAACAYLEWKHTFFDESVKVPLILSWPGRLPAGERRGQVVNLIDLTATMLDALDAPALPGAQGRSFLAVARSPSAPWLDETVSEYCTDESPAWTGGMAVQTRMLRQGRWKLNYYHGYDPQLFDLEADPAEQDDLGTSRAHATVRQGMLHRLLADWDPEAVRRRMRARRLDKDLLGAWARHVQPESHHLWTVRPEQNRLDAWNREDA